MDADLKKSLEDMEARLGARFDQAISAALGLAAEEMEARLGARFDQAISAALSTLAAEEVEMEARLGARFDKRFDNLLQEGELKAYLQGMEERSAALIASEVGTLHTEIQDVEQRLGARLDEMNVRLDTHAGLLQTGSRQMARFLRFSESSSKYWRAMAKRVDALEKANGAGKRKRA